MVRAALVSTLIVHSATPFDAGWYRDTSAQVRKGYEGCSLEQECTRGLSSRRRECREGVWVGAGRSAGAHCVSSIRVSSAGSIRGM